MRCHSLFRSSLFFVFLTQACSRDTKATDVPPETQASPPAKSAQLETPELTVVKTPSLPKTEPPSPVHVFRGDVRRTGQSDYTGPRKPILKWVFRTTGRIYTDPVVMPDGTVLTGSHDGHLYAINPDGLEKWSFDAQGKIWSSPAVADDGTIYFGSDADMFFAVDQTGRVKWTLNTTVPEKRGQSAPAGMWDVDTSPAIAPDGTIYFGCHYFLYALRPNGDIRWRFQAGIGRVKIFSSPAIGNDGAVYFGTQGRRFFALDPNATPLWNVETEKDNDSTPVVGKHGEIFFASDDGFVRAVSPKDGSLLWKTDLAAPIRAPLALSNDHTIFAATYGKAPFVAALSAKDGKEKWRFSIEPGEGDFYGIQSGVTIDKDGYLYFGGRDHYVYCLTPDGKLKWRYKTGDQVDSGAVLGPDGTLYIGSDDKRLYAFAPSP